MPCVNSHYVLSAPLPAAALQTHCPSSASDRFRLLAGEENLYLSLGDSWYYTTYNDSWFLVKTG